MRSVSPSLPRLLPLPLPLVLVLAGCAAQTSRPAAAESLEHINMTDDSPYPFSSAVRMGDTLYLSGQIGTHIDQGAPKLVAGGIEPETRQALENIKAVLAKSGSSLDRVAKCLVMMADMNEWPTMNKIYAGYFPGPKPARSAWGATALALGARVEITCIATIGRRGPG